MYKRDRHRGEQQALGELWQKLKMLIGVISKGEAAEGRGRKQSGRRDRQCCEESRCKGGRGGGAPRSM